MLRRRFNQNVIGEYMTLVASEGNTKFTVIKESGVKIQRFYYSINGGKWTKVNFVEDNQAHFNVAYRGNIRFKSDTFISQEVAKVTFTSTMPFSITGNIMSLGYFDDAKGKTSIGDNKYACLFELSLVRHVDTNFLPATTLEHDCYSRMFFGCANLTTSPELPATTLATYCYYGMFGGCTSLTVAPELPATTLDYACYREMFRGCTSLTTAPELPATTLAERCYYYMFDGCSSLNYIKMLATDISASSCLTNWVSGVSSTGTFVKNPAMTSLPSGNSGIPSGWAVVDDGEE